jgi:hypothetical protein
MITPFMEATEGEMQKYGKRLWALQEKGLTVKIS